MTATLTSRCFTNKPTVGALCTGRCTATLGAVTRVVPKSPSCYSLEFRAGHRHPMAVTRAVHTLLSGAPLFFQLHQPFSGGTATPRAVPTQPPFASVSSRGFVRASTSSHLELLASLLGYQHLLQCLFLSVDHFLHVPNLVQVRVASY